MKYKFVNVYDPVHKHYVALACGNYTKWYNWVKSLDSTAPIEENNTSSGKYLSNGKYYFVWLKKKSDLGVLVHECDHLVNDFMWRRGIKLDIENDESHAYLIEFWFNELKKNLKLL